MYGEAPFEPLVNILQQVTTDQMQTKSCSTFSGCTAMQCTS